MTHSTSQGDERERGRRRRQGHAQAVAERMPRAVVVLRAEALGYDRVEAHRDAHDEEGDQDRDAVPGGGGGDRDGSRACRRS